MVYLILALITLTVYLFAIVSCNAIPTDPAEADLYLRGGIEDWRNNGF